MDIALLLTFYIEETSSLKALFGGISLAALSNFILIKGIKGTEYASISFDLLGGQTIKEFLNNELLFVMVLTLFCGISFLMD